MNMTPTLPPNDSGPMDCGPLTSSWVGRHARALVWLVNDLAQQTPDSDGPNRSVYSPKSGPLGWSGRIRPVWQARQMVMFSTPLKIKWPKWGIRWGGACGALPTLARPTRDSESLLSDGWRTPTASMVNADRGIVEYSRRCMDKGVLVNLAHQVKAGTWPTPRAYSFADSHTPGLTALDVRVRGLYPDNDRYWPTPTVNDAGNATNPPSQAQRHVPGLATVAAMWATPTRSDGMGGPGNSGRDGGDNLRTQVLDEAFIPWGQNDPDLTDAQMDVIDRVETLSPFWVAQLQGLPDGWLDSPTPVSQEARRAACISPQWPARPGQPQHEFERPRVLTERMKGRGAMLRGLGNLCCPVQAYPLFKAIMEEDAAS